MLSNELLNDAFSRVRAVVHSAIEDASIEVLTYRADSEANTIAWLVWHLTRGQGRPHRRPHGRGAAVGQRRLGRALRPTV